MNSIVVGAGKRVSVPEHWTPASGVCLPNDMFVNVSTGEFRVVDEEEIGLPASDFDLLIRKRGETIEIDSAVEQLIQKTNPV